MKTGVFFSLKRSLQTLLLPALIAAMATVSRAEDVYYDLPLLHLEATQDGRLTQSELEELFTPPDDRMPDRTAVRVVLNGQGEAYLRSTDEESARWGGPFDYRAHLVLRVPAGTDVSGLLFLPNRLEFTLPEGAEPTDAARSEFYRAKEEHYEHLLARQFTGGAWFRHQAHEARVARLGEQADDRTGESESVRRPTELEDTYALFSGGRALSENIQLDRLLAVGERTAATVPLDELEGITIEEIDWAPLLEGVEAEPDPLARLIPHDQHVLFFPSFSALVRTIDEAQKYGTPMLRSIEPTSQDSRVLERYQRQLCLSLDDLTRAVGPAVVKSLALTGSDPYFRTGTDVAVLLELQPAGLEVMRAFIQHRYAAAADELAAEQLKGEIRGQAYVGAATADRRISSYMCELEGALVVTNSLAQLEQLLAVEAGEVPSLASLDEYKFFRRRYPRSDSAETALLIVSDATIRRWCGPRWRIAASRRTRAMAVLSELQARHADEVVAGLSQPLRLVVEYSLAEMGDITLDETGPVSSTYGTLAFNTPIREFEFSKVTPEEEEAYRRFRERYQWQWRQFFDPVALRLSLAPQQVAGDLTVMPLSENTDYDELIGWSEGAELAPDAGDRHPQSLLHLVVALNKDAPVFRRRSNILEAFAPDQGNPLGWMGDSVALYLDQDPFWQEMAAAEDQERFLWDNYQRLPLAIRAEVKSTFKAVAFLTALRGFIEQSAPDMTIWETISYGERSYVRITATDGPGRGQDPWALYYSVSPEAIVVTLNEDLLKRSIDREVARQQAEAEGAEPPDTGDLWLGKSAALRVDDAMLLLVGAFVQEENRREMQRVCWRNLPILNQWHARYPEEDPVELHERLWKTRLVCPGGGEYVWNEEHQTMESTAYGHPGQPREGPSLTPLLAELSGVDFGVTFENDGLRARMVVDRAEQP